MRSILVLLLLATPAFSQEFFASGEALCWRPVSDDFANAFDSDLLMDHEWEAGVRATLGVQLPSCWKGSWTYTWFAAEDARDWTPPQAIGGPTSYGDLDYQVHDFDVARVFWLHPNCQLEPFVGFRWGQIDYTLDDTMGASFVFLDSKTDSYGLRIGSKARWSLTESISLFGHGSFSGLFSTTENRGIATDTAPWDVTDNHENHAADAAAGVAWQCGMLEVAAGYEWNWWANAIQRRDSTSQPDYENLLLEGAFLRLTGRF
ncbi:MAG: Lpg1974 family pore-forming outer membrane protein [Thermoguttaceae bacterium]